MVQKLNRQKKKNILRGNLRRQIEINVRVLGWIATPPGDWCSNHVPLPSENSELLKVSI